MQCRNPPGHRRGGRTHRFTLTCPKCQAEFVAEAQPEASSQAKQATKKPIKAARRRDDEDDDDDDTPRKRRKQAAGGPNTKLLVGGIAVGLLVVGGIVAAVIAMSGGDNDKNKDQAKADPPAQQPVDTKTQQPVDPQPEQKQQKQQPKDQNPPPKKSGPNPVTKAKEKDDEVLIQVDPRLPAPPKVRLSGTPLAGGGKLDAKVDSPPAFVPIAKDEDPFIRARNFAPDGPVPPLAKLPQPHSGRSLRSTHTGTPRSSRASSSHRKGIRSLALVRTKRSESGTSRQANRSTRFDCPLAPVKKARWMLRR